MGFNIGQAVKEANAALQSGNSPDAAVDQAVASTVPDPQLDTGSMDSEYDDRVVRAEHSTEDGDNLAVSDEDTQEDSSESPKAEATAEEKPTEKTSEKDVIIVTDDQGRRRKLEIDYSDKNKTKKAYELAAGARKWQAERDQALAQTKQLTERMSSYDLLEKAWKEKGEEGVVDLLAGRQGHFQELMKKRAERERFLAEASPEEVKQLQEREASEHAKKELEKLRQENEEFKKKVTEEREAAEIRSLEGRIHPAFAKYRFAGRLGNDTHEARLDKMLWNDVLERLEPYEEKGLDISPELIEKEFAVAARDIRQIFGKQAEKKASRVVEQKKQEATENVQAAVKSGYTAGGSAKEAQDLVNAGNTRALFKNWSKMAKYFPPK